MFCKNEFCEAYINYSEAHLIKPGEIYPVDQIKIVLVEIRILEKDSVYMMNYNNRIRVADSCLSKNDHLCAKSYYQLAYKLRPHKQYPKDQSTKCDIILKQKRKRAEFEHLIDEGKEAIKRYDYYSARNLFYNALHYEDDSSEIKHVYQKIYNLDSIIGELNKLDGYDVKTKIKSGKVSVADAIIYYEKGLKLNPENESVIKIIRWLKDIETTGILKNCDCDSLKKNAPSIQKMEKRIGQYKESKNGSGNFQCGYFINGELYIGFIIYPSEYKNEVIIPPGFSGYFLGEFVGNCKN